MFTYTCRSSETVYLGLVSLAEIIAQLLSFTVNMNYSLLLTTKKKNNRRWVSSWFFCVDIIESHFLKNLNTFNEVKKKISGRLE